VSVIRSIMILSCNRCCALSFVMKGSNILIKFGVPVKVFRLIKMCLNEICSEVCICKYLSDAFPVQNGLKQSELFFSFALECAIGNSKQKNRQWN
jgi:hypothetical protein